MSQMNNDLLIKIDETIKVVCEKVKRDNGSSSEYAERIKALAALIEARTNIKDNPINVRKKAGI